MATSENRQLQSDTIRFHISQKLLVEEYLKNKKYNYSFVDDIKNSTTGLIIDNINIPDAFLLGAKLQQFLSPDQDLFIGAEY